MAKRTRDSTDNLKPMLTISEVSHILNVHPNTLRRWSKQGLIRTYRIGLRGERRYRRQDIDKLLSQSIDG